MRSSVAFRAPTNSSTLRSDENSIFAPDQDLLGAEVLGAHVDEALDVLRPLDRTDDAVGLALGGRLTDQQALHLGGEHDRDHDQQHADRHRSGGVEAGVAGGGRQDHADEGHEQTTQRAEVLEQHDGQFGLTGGADEVSTSSCPASFEWRLSCTAVRIDHPSSTMAIRRIPMAIGRLSMSCGWRSFWMPSYRANMPPIENSTGRRRRPRSTARGRSRTDASGWPPSSPVDRRGTTAPGCPVSAIEWTVSASRLADPVRRNPTNFVRAIPRLARNAASIALRLPSVTPGILRSAFTPVRDQPGSPAGSPARSPARDRQPGVRPPRRRR